MFKSGFHIIATIDDRCDLCDHWDLRFPYDRIDRKETSSRPGSDKSEKNYGMQRLWCALLSGTFLACVSKGSYRRYRNLCIAVARIARIAAIATFYGFHMIAKIAEHFFLRSLRLYGNQALESISVFRSAWRGHQIFTKFIQIFTTNKVFYKLF